MRKRACAALAIALIVLPAVDAGCSSRGNPWTVVTVREPRSGEIPFEDASRYLWPSEDANNVPGPDSLIAHVRTDEQHHAYIEIENLRTGKTVLLLKANACLPKWSPNGKYISCSVWKSHRQMSVLTVVDVATRTILLEPEVNIMGVEMKWSPDSHTLVADGPVYARPYAMLYTVSIPDGRVMVLDTTHALSSHEYSWSPDARWVAFTRPTKLDSDENPVAVDLWIADARTGKAWRSLDTPDWLESNPLWITNRTIQVDRVHWDGNQRGAEQRVVIELSRE